MEKNGIGTKRHMRILEKAGVSQKDVELAVQTPRYDPKKRVDFTEVQQGLLPRKIVESEASRLRRESASILAEKLRKRNSDLLAAKSIARK